MSELGEALELAAAFQRDEARAVMAAALAVKFQTAFPLLFDMVWQDHETRVCTAGGHDVFHPIIVAQYAALIAPEERLETLGWLAGMCHNTDRIFPKEEVRERVAQYLASTSGVSDTEKEFITDAVLTHSGLNKDSDNPVTVVLKDADRLSGLGFLCAIRASQSLAGVRILDPRYVGTTSPGSTFRNIKTVLDGIKFTLEWRKMLRLPKAKELAKELCQKHQEIIDFLENRIIKGLGLDSFRF